jgi:hypothetical protein
MSSLVMILSIDFTRFSNGYMKMVVLGMKILVLRLQKKVTLKYSNGYVKINVLGMKILVLMLHKRVGLR